MARVARTFEYAITLDRAGTLLAEDEVALELPEAWSPEHLVLAALTRCVIVSLRHHAERAGVDARADASASGVVTARDEDDRYAFVDVVCRLDVELDPIPDEGPGELLARAESGCFIGSSLTAKPRYEWRVNGEPVSASG